MPSTATYAPTEDPYLDGVLSGVKWGTTSLTFSFPTSGSTYGSSYAGGENLNNFKAFTTTQQVAVRDILKMYASVANLTFTEVTETSTTHGDIRYAESDSPSTAWAYYPSTSDAGGDAWFGNSSHYYDNPLKGNYAYLTMIHETGHAMGLKHPQDASGSFGVMPLDHDSLEYTVMSYRSYIGASTTTGYTNGSTSYPQTLMMFDIEALQKLYGANYSTNSGDSVYRWNATTGEMSINGVGLGTPAGNKVFMTLWDGGGHDTYDFSNYTTGVKVDLNPGGWTTTSATQLASLGSGHIAIGNVANALLYNGNTASLIEDVIGTSAADTIVGNVLDNRITGGGGNDTIDGGAGTDTAVFSGSKASYSWLQLSSDSWTVTDLRTGAPDGVDTLKSIEVLQFADSVLTLGTDTTTTTTTQPPPPPPPPPANTAPVAYADAYSTAKGTKLVVTAASGVLKNDIDADGNPLTAVLVTGPGKGSFTLNADGSFVYTPAKNFTGTVSFTYKDSDGTANSNVATVTISVGTAGQTAGHGAGTDDGMENAPAPAFDYFNSQQFDDWTSSILQHKSHSAFVYSDIASIHIATPEEIQEMVFGPNHHALGGGVH